jgi:hypothetical protein
LSSRAYGPTGACRGEAGEAEALISRMESMAAQQHDADQAASPFAPELERGSSSFPVRPLRLMMSRSHHCRPSLELPVKPLARFHQTSAELGIEHIRDYRRHILSRGLKAKSILPIMGALRFFLRHPGQQGADRADHLRPTRGHAAVSCRSDVRPRQHSDLTFRSHPGTDRWFRFALRVGYSCLRPNRLQQ